MKRVASVWALVGVSLLFGFAVVRLSGRGFGTVSAGLTPTQWLVLSLGVAFFVYTEGVMALERRWVPRLVDRARELRGESRVLHRALAPLYGMSLIGATPSRLRRAWLGVAAIVLLVTLIRALPEPWRGIVDLSVAAALTWGVIAILRRLRSVAE
jgi:hypothetical protein